MSTPTPNLGLARLSTADDVEQIYLAVNDHANKLDTRPLPVGALVPFAAAAAPTGFLLCDGASQLRSAYAALFAVIGTTYGSVDGTHFNVPDLRGRVPVGVDGAANRLAANDALGNSGGEEKHQLTVAELASHSHPNSQNYGSAGGQFGVQATGSAGNNNASAFVGNTGGDTAHNNMQPFVIVTYIIKA
jgi:microcystin-dependent protein